LREQLEERNRILEMRNLVESEANRLKSMFLAGMSHELRTPLDSIIGSSDLLLSDGKSKLTPTQRDHISDILNSGNHLLQLINDILDLARVEAGKMDIEPEPFSPKKALDEVRSVVSVLAVERQIELTVRVDPSLRMVVLDPLRFKQILYNLVSNAIKFTDPGGKVTVSLAPRGGRKISLSVKDTGIGISPADLPRLFREFEQLESGPERHYQGSGLGLSLTKKLVDLMGGTVSVRSALQKGSTFTVVLPRTSEGPDVRPRAARRS
jgi:signal transduction histidine kinase